MPILYPNIMILKHTLEVKRNQLVSNRDISRGAKVNHVTIGKLVRSNISLIYLSTMGKLAQYFQNEGLDINIGDFFSWSDNQQLVLNIGPLIQGVNPIPTDSEIAQVTNIPNLRLENLIRGNVKRVYLDDLARLFVFLEERGVRVEIGDLLRIEG